MTARFLTSASFRQDASAQAIIRTLDPRDPELALDTHHQLIWSLFAEEAGEDGKRDFLWRHDDGRFQILSAREPRDSHRLFALETRPLDLHFDAGDRLVFRLRVNATVSKGDGKRRSPKHDVVMDELRRLQAERPTLERHEARDEAIPVAAEGWLRRAGERTGFELDRLVDATYRTLELRRRAGQGAERGRAPSEKRGKASPARFGVLDLDGVLVVREPAAFVDAVGSGFGRGKAFGFGLMLLDRA